MEGSFYVGFIGNIISFLMFLSPVSTFKRIIEQGSTENFESVPYICTLLNSSLWTYYGLIKPEILVSTINGFGAIVEFIYVILYLIFAPRKMKIKTWILVGLLDVGFLAAAIVVPKLALQKPHQVDALGLICAGLNVVMYGSPLVAMKTVVKTKSVEYMPFFLSFFLFLNGATWTLYAVLERDVYLMVPNGIGCFFGVVQLILYTIYKNSKSSKRELSERLIEEGSQQHSSITSTQKPKKNIKG